MEGLKKLKEMIFKRKKLSGPLLKLISNSRKSKSSNPRETFQRKGITLRQRFNEYAAARSDKSKAADNILEW